MAEIPPGIDPTAGREKLRAAMASAPNASGMSEAQFALAAHQNHYSDMPLVDYLARVGLNRSDVLFDIGAHTAEKENDPYVVYAREALTTAGTDETPEHTSQRLGGSLPERRAEGVEGTSRAWLQGRTFGFGDEVVAAGAAALDPLVHGGDRGEFGERFDAYLGREQQLVDDFREDNPLAAYGGELVGGVQTGMQTGGRLMPARGGTVPRALAGGGIAFGEGALYGFGAGEGGFESRAQNALGSGVLSSALGVAAPVVGQVMRQAIKPPATRPGAALMSPGIKAQSQAGFRAAEATGDVISQQSLRGLQQDVAQVLMDAGAALPSGKIPQDLPHIRSVVKAINQYAQGPMTMPQFSMLRHALGRAARSADKTEAMIAGRLERAFFKWFGGVPEASRAAPLVQQARGDWGRFVRTKAIENAITEARRFNGGFAEGLRSQFKNILRSQTKASSFSKAELEAMDAFVNGGAIDKLLGLLQASGRILGAGGAGLLVHPMLGSLMIGTGMAARGARNQGARNTATQLLHGAAGVPMPPTVLGVVERGIRGTRMPALVGYNQ
jgi:hypothetical protein